VFSLKAAETWCPSSSRGGFLPTPPHPDKHWDPPILLSRG